MFKIFKILALYFIVGLLSTPSLAYTSICKRTKAVQSAILERLWESDCAKVTKADLEKIHILNISDKGLESLAPEDFAGLSSLNTLFLDRNNLSSLPPNVFANLSSLYFLWLQYNNLTSLPPNVFANLPRLEGLYLHKNNLSSLPRNIFSNLPSLEELKLGGNRLDQSKRFKLHSQAKVRIYLKTSK